MLWAEENNVLANGPLWGAASVIVTGLGAWLISFYKERTAADQKAKLDAVLAWKNLFDTQQSQNTAQIASQNLQLAALGSQVLNLTDKHARCEAESAGLRAEMESLRASVFKMQMGCTLKDGCPLLADGEALRRQHKQDTLTTGGDL